MARELVPGDTVCLSVGERVPADLRLFEVDEYLCCHAHLGPVAFEELSDELELQALVGLTGSDVSAVLSFVLTGE